MEARSGLWVRGVLGILVAPAVELRARVQERSLSSVDSAISALTLALHSLDHRHASIRMMVAMATGQKIVGDGCLRVHT